jgi:hypothetical protein
MSRSFGLGYPNRHVPELATGVGPVSAPIPTATPPGGDQRSGTAENRTRMRVLAGDGRDPSHSPVVESAGLEPAFRRCERRVFPLDDDPIVESTGIEPVFRDCQPRVLPLDELPMAGLEGIEPSSAVLEAALQPLLRPVAPPAGVEPSLTPWTVALHHRMHTTAIFVPPPRVERGPSRLGNECLVFRQDEGMG